MRDRGRRQQDRGRGDLPGSKAEVRLEQQPLTAAEPRAVLEAVATNPALQREHVVQRELIEQAVAGTTQPRLRQKMGETFSNMLQGKWPSFNLLEGARCCSAGSLCAL
jgi:hypothetical protein